MKNTLILHWWGSNSDDNFFPWLKKEVEFKVDEIFVPNLPSTTFPVLEEQLEYLSVYNSDFKEGWNIIGHSLWAQLALHYVIDNNIRNTNIVLVAPSYNDIMSDTWEEIFWTSVDTIKVYFNKIINFNKLNKLWNKTTILLSDNDPYINLESAKKYFSQIKNIEFLELKNKGHFTVIELEETLEYLD